jgi:hypothetical protein
VKRYVLACTMVALLAACATERFEESGVVAVLRIILSTQSPQEYLEAQDRSIEKARTEHLELTRVAARHPDIKVRVEALALAELTERPEAKELLRDVARGDPEPCVRQHASFLLFRQEMASQVRSQPSVDYAAYRRNSRLSYARVRFGLPADGG